MRKSFLKAFGYFACLAWSGMACAVGFGGINVTSSLGRPLAAEIELVAVEKADKASLNAHLASPDAFKGAGIDYPSALPKLKFSVETRANGEFYIKAVSDQAINEPFVSLLIELTWSSGRLLREYTFLLDPPGFVAEQPAVAVKPIEPVVVAPVVVAPVVASAPVAASAPVSEPVPQVASAPAVAEAPQAAAEVAPAPTAPAPLAEAIKPVEPVTTAELPPAEKKSEPVPAKQKNAMNRSADSVAVKRGDTLSKIANQTKSSDVSLERMLVALYRANAEAFDGNNMNRLRTGKILRMPQGEELGKLQQAEAANEVRAQVDDWNAYRQQLAAVKAPAAEQHAKQEVSGKISTAIVDKAPAAKESAKEVLKLSKGEAPGDQAAAGGKAKLAKEEEAVAKAKALKEAEQRTALLEKNIKDMQRLVELKNQAAAKAAQSSVVATSSAVAPASAPASAVAAVTPKPKVIAPKVVPAEPSLIDEILGNPIYLGGGAAVLLGLGGLAFVRMRKAKAGEKKAVAKAEEIGSATGRITAPVAPSPETGDFTNQFAVAPLTVSDDEVDPIGEADMFLNFGRDVQAEEVLKDALIKDPANNLIKLKLLSIYANRKDTKSFYVYALEIKASGDAGAWGQAAAMGLVLEPNNPLYGGSAAETAGDVDDAALPAVDFDLGLAGSGAEQATQVLDIESNIPVGEQTAIMSASEMRDAQEVPMDFDVTSTHTGGKAAEEEPTLDISAMDFDITSTQSEARGAAAVEPKFDLPAMDFDVTGVPATAATVATPTVESPALDLDDLVFEVPSKTTPALAEPSLAVEADKGLAFTIDIPTEVQTEAVAKPVAPISSVGLGEISLTLDDLPAQSAPAATEVRDERWQEVATKLDLAKAYQEMGDQAGAREILEEVVRDGDEKQRATAQELLQQQA